MQKTHRFTLPNGMTVILAPDNKAPVVTFQNWVRVGSADEKADEAGLAHVLEHMLFKGTQRRGVGKIAQEIEGCGGDINAFTSFDATVYYVVVASRFFDQGLDVLADSAQNSIIDPGELNLEKEVILEEIKRGEDSPGGKLSHGLFSKSFQKHPYGRPVIGYRKIVAGASRDKIFDFYRRWYVPSNMVFVAVGDFDWKEAASKIRGQFGKWKAHKAPVRRRPKEPTQNKIRGFGLKDDTQEFFFDFAFHIPGMGHADVAALDLLSVVVGQGEQSRLVWKLHHTDRVVTGLQAYAYTPRDPGLMLVSGTASLEQPGHAVEATMEEVFRVLRDPIQEEELERARTCVEADTVYERETMQGIARKLGFYEVVAGDLKLEKEYYKGIAKADVGDLMRMAKKYLHPDNLTIGVLGSPESNNPTVQQMKSWARQSYKRSTRPVGSRIRKVKGLGRKKEGCLTLPNGAKLLLRSDRSIPLVSMRAVFLGGLRHETPENNGLSSLVARVISKGTRQRSYTEILRKIDSFGGGLSGFAGYNSFGLRMETLSRHLNEAASLFSDCLMDPVFDARELDVEREQVLEGIKTLEDHLASYVMRMFTSNLYSTHPFHMSILGTQEKVSGYSSEDLQSFYRQRAVPGNMVLGVVGDFDLNEMADVWGRNLENWQGPKYVEPKVSPEKFSKEARKVVAHKQREQAHIVMGFPGVTIYDQDRYALELLASILAGQGGRLFMELRDKQGLAYTVTAMSQEALDPGYFVLYMATDHTKLDRATDGIRSELTKIFKDGVTQDELKRNVQQVVGSYEIDLQKAGARAAALAFNERYGLGHDHYQKYTKEILAVTRDQVVEVARKYLDFDRSVTAVVGPAPSTRTEVSSGAPVRPAARK